MDYSGIMMIPEVHTDVRYALIKDGKRLMIVVGFNPSTADESKPDRTMQSVMRIAEHNGYDGFAMLNLYPLRSTSPDLLPSTADEALHRQNMEMLERILANYPTADVVLAFGNLVYRRKYTLEYAREIWEILKKEQRLVLCIDVLGSGMPKHPLYAKSTTVLKDFKLP